MSLSIVNHQGYSLNVSRNENNQIQAELKDKWGMLVKDGNLMVIIRDLSDAELSTETPHQILLNKFTQYSNTGNRFGFSIHQRGERKVVEIGPYGLRGGGIGNAVSNAASRNKNVLIFTAICITGLYLIDKIRSYYRDTSTKEKPL